MVDMGQASSDLYQKPLSMQHNMAWTVALRKAAEALGYEHYMDVPDQRVEELRTLARSIQGGNK